MAMAPKTSMALVKRDGAQFRASQRNQHGHLTSELVMVTKFAADPETTSKEHLAFTTAVRSLRVATLIGEFLKFSFLGDSLIQPIIRPGLFVRRSWLVFWARVL